MMNSLSSAFLLNRMRKHLRLKKLELEEIQRQKLQLLMTHAYKQVPYYRQLFEKASLKPEHIQQVKDLEKFPITDKSILRGKEKNEIMASNVDIKECVKVCTSGSTGMPTNIYFTREDYNLIDLYYFRSFLENGLKFKHKRVFFLDPHSFDTKRRWYHLLGLARYENISCFLDLSDQVKLLEKADPDFIHGYPSSLSQIARHLLDEGNTGIRPLIISTAAELLHEKDRLTIKEAFGVNPLDRYAARECGNIAWQCNERYNYHINIDAMIVEFIKNDRPAGPGERADVVITNLHSYAMPFIRYKLGDVGVLSDKKCQCGMNLPLMEIIEGRDEDFIVLKSGKRVSPMMVTGALDYIDGIKQFRAIQEELDTIIAVIARGKEFGPNTVPCVKKELQEILGNDIHIKCKVVDNIPGDPSGKVRAVMSKIS